MTNVISEPEVKTAVPTLELVAVPMPFLHQSVLAFGSPSEARRLGADAVDEYGEALRRLAES